MAPVGLTRRQAELLAFLRTYSAEHGRMPTLQEQIDHIGCKSRTSAWHLLQQLERRGHIRKLPQTKGGIELLQGPWDIPSIIRTELDEHCQRAGRSPGSVIGDALLVYLRHPSRRVDSCPE